MDATWSFKPAVTAVNFDSVRPAGGSTAAASPTVLPSPQTVRPASQTGSPRNDGEAQPDRGTKGEVVIDPNSHEVIYRVRDAETRLLVWQVPDAATLRMRAYTRAAETNGEQSGAVAHTDVEA